MVCGPVFSTVRPICTSRSPHRRSSASARSVSPCHPARRRSPAAPPLARRPCARSGRSAARVAAPARSASSRQAANSPNSPRGVGAQHLPRRAGCRSAEPAQGLAHACVQSRREFARGDGPRRLQHDDAFDIRIRAAAFLPPWRASTPAARALQWRGVAPLPMAGRCRCGANRPGGRTPRRHPADRCGRDAFSPISARGVTGRASRPSPRSVGSTAAATGLERGRRVAPPYRGGGTRRRFAPDPALLDPVVDDDADDQRDAADDETELERGHAPSVADARTVGAMPCKVATRSRL